jgi:hypothetical protein
MRSKSSSAVLVDVIAMSEIDSAPVSQLIPTEQVGGSPRISRSCAPDESEIPGQKAGLYQFGFVAVYVAMKAAVNCFRPPHKRRKKVIFR